MKTFKISIKLLTVVLLAFVIIITTTGCRETHTKVENLMKITDDFVGERVVTLEFDKNISNNQEKQKTIEDIIKEKCPNNLSYRTETVEGTYKCVFVLSFSSLDEYKTKVASVIGRQIAVAYGYTNTILSKGTYYKEDYDGMDLVAWLDDALYQEQSAKIELETESTSNVVKYNSEVFSSKTSTLNTSTVKGEAVRGVKIATTNHKNTLYDRTMTLSVPIATYNKLGASLQELMLTRVNPEGVYSWKQNNDCMEFTVKYEKIDLAKLQEYTKLFVDCRNESIYYGDQNKSSTPLAEQLVFEERINLLSFVSGTEAPIQMDYSYTLPEETTHGEGVGLSNGEWETCGQWTNSTYKVTDTNGVYDIRVPDGMQYTIKGININLTDLGENNFKRSVDFVYDSNTGQKGLDYAYNFLALKGFTVSKESVPDGIACRVTQQGTDDEINNAVADLFGSGNNFEYSKHTNDLSVVTDINVTDNVNISHMLTGANSNIKINYTAKSESKEYIRNVNIINKATNIQSTARLDENKNYTAIIDGANFSMNYSATLPYFNGIALYCTICTTIILIAALTIALLIRYNRKLKAIEESNTNKEVDNTKKSPATKNKKIEKPKNNDIEDDYIKKHYGF
ncbi:MAG: hypothetical protein UHY68_08060 [Acutalibacteraceae bacterium]|nr:hypothetical protein [Acutalibacteraceae bacterium]